MVNIWLQCLFPYQLHIEIVSCLFHRLLSVDKQTFIIFAHLLWVVCFRHTVIVKLAITLYVFLFRWVQESVTISVKICFVCTGSTEKYKCATVNKYHTSVVLSVLFLISGTFLRINGISLFLERFKALCMW